jgi:hypothetical protein
VVSTQSTTRYKKCLFFFFFFFKPQRKMHNVLLSGGKIVTGPGSIEHPMDDDATFLLWSKTNQTAG